MIMLHSLAIFLVVAAAEPDDEIALNVGQGELIELSDVTSTDVLGGVIRVYPRGSSSVRILGDLVTPGPPMIWVKVNSRPPEDKLTLLLATAIDGKLAYREWSIRVGIAPQPPPDPEPDPKPKPEPGPEPGPPKPEPGPPKPEPDPKPKPEPDPEPTGAGQLICIRPWVCSVDQADEILTIRESLDSAGSTVPYFVCLPGTLGEDMTPHTTIAAYRSLVTDPSKPWIFHVVPTAGKPRIAHQGPVDADQVMAWIGVQRAQLGFAHQANEDQWLDVEFSEDKPELCGSLPPTLQAAQYRAKTESVDQIEGFEPIRYTDWNAWTERFPIERLAANLRHTTKQVMGSCVGHSCANSCEGAEYYMAGDLFFRRLSAMSMYRRIGSRPNSGAYVGTAASEIFEQGILPAAGEVDSAGAPYAHSHQVSGGFYDRLPGGWEATAKAWRCQVYRVDNEQSAFRVLMDCSLRTHFGRSGHAISGFAVTRKRNWAYENSWGNDWGDLGKSVGYDRRFYDAYVYIPVLRDECAVLVAESLAL